MLEKSTSVHKQKYLYLVHSHHWYEDSRVRRLEAGSGRFPGMYVFFFFFPFPPNMWCNNCSSDALTVFFFFVGGAHLWLASVL